MLTVFRDFVKNTLLAQTSRYTGAGELNRHGIVHGLFKGYGCEANFYKLVSFLDLLEEAGNCHGSARRGGGAQLGALHAGETMQPPGAGGEDGLAAAFVIARLIACRPPRADLSAETPAR
jgi:hypothetical protein